MRFSKVLFVLLILTVQLAKAQDTTIKVSSSMFDTISDQLSFANNSIWTFRPGNDTAWARPDIATTGWLKVPAPRLKHYADKNGRLEGWFRMKVKFDKSLYDKTLWIDFPSWAAIRFYVDGKLMATRGNLGDNGKEFSPYLGDLDPLAISFHNDTVHTFAIHFVGYLSPFPPNDLEYQAHNNDIIKIIGPNPYTHSETFRAIVYSFFNTWLVGCAALSILFWLLAFQNRQESNLIWIALCTTLFTVFNFSTIKENAIGLHFTSFYIYNTIGYFSIFSLFIIIPILLTRVFNRKLNPTLSIFLVVFFLLNLIRSFVDFSIIINELIIIGTILSALGICLYYIISSWKNLQGAQWAIVAGLFFSLFTFLAGEIYASVKGSANLYFSLGLLSFFILSFPLSLLVYVSMRFKEIIREVRLNANKVLQLSEEKRIQAESQQKLLQEEVHRQTTEIRQTLNDLKATQAQLIQSEKMAGLGEVTAGIAHEIQNPLNFVNNFSEVSNELILEMKDEFAKGDIDEGFAIADDIKQNLEKINYHGKRADAIVKSMLEHSRVSSGTKEPTDINKLADEFLRLAYHGLSAKDNTFSASIETHFDETIGKINIVPQDMGRVLLNLYNNAFYAVNERFKLKISGFEPKVTVTTKKLLDKIEISVKDNGNGIPHSIRDKIFQPFFTTKPTGHGTGLGLSLSFDIVKTNRGRINVNSKEGDGTEFIVELPIT